MQTSGSPTPGLTLTEEARREAAAPVVSATWRAELDRDLWIDEAATPETFETHGILWAHVFDETLTLFRSVAERPHDPDFPVAFRWRSSSYANGSVRAIPRPADFPEFRTFDPYLFDDCVGCGGGLGAAFPAVRLDDTGVFAFTPGGAVPEDGVVSVKTGERLLDMGPLVVTDEPRALLDRLGVAWHGLRLSADRTSLEAVFALTPAGFYGALAEPTNYEVAPPVPPGALLVGAASRGLVFQLGGVGADADGRLWELTPEVGWRSVPLFGAGVGQVLAATYRYQDDALYALTAERAQGREEVRLVRVLRTGHASLLRAWPRAGRSDLRLSQGHRGELVISFSNPRRRAHAVLVLQRDEDGTWRPTHLQSGPGALLERAHLSTATLSLLLADRAGPRAVQLPRHGLPAIAGYQACAPWW